MEKLGTTIFVIAYTIGQPATYIYLMWESWNQTEGVLGWVIMLGGNFFLSMIWPIYWAILHWLF